MTSTSLTKPEPLTHRIHVWTGTVAGLAGMILGIIALVQTQKNAALSRKLEAYDSLSTAWDLMGGKPGTTTITTPTSDSTKLEQARRLIEERALVVDPKNVRAHRMRGVYYHAVGKDQIALEAHRRAVQLDPSNASSRAALAKVHVDLGQYQQAEIAYKKAIKQDQGNPHIFRNLAVMFSRQGRYEEAVENLRIAIEIDPKYEAAYNILYPILKTLGEDDEAKEVYARAEDLRMQKRAQITTHSTGLEASLRAAPSQ